MFNEIMFLFCLLFCVHSFAIDALKVHASFAESFTCSEHWDGQFKYEGDALGTDCVVQESVPLW